MKDHWTKRHYSRTCCILMTALRETVNISCIQCFSGSHCVDCYMKTWILNGGWLPEGILRNAQKVDVKELLHLYKLGLLHNFTFNVLLLLFLFSCPKKKSSCFPKDIKGMGWRKVRVSYWELKHVTKTLETFIHKKKSKTF